jgi:hypothetical protein
LTSESVPQANRKLKEFRLNPHCVSLAALFHSPSMRRTHKKHSKVPAIGGFGWLQPHARCHPKLGGKYYAIAGFLCGFCERQRSRRPSLREQALVPANGWGSQILSLGFTFARRSEKMNVFGSPCDPRPAKIEMIKLSSVHDEIRFGSIVHITSTVLDSSLLRKGEKDGSEF